MQRLSFAAVLTLVLLAGCASVGGLDASSPPRVIDPLSDDLTKLVVALDLPRGIGTVEGGTTLALAASGMAPMRIVLVEADADAVSGLLPPPAVGRAYYFLGIDAAAQATIRKAQAAMRTSGLHPTLTLAPELCASGAVDLKALTVAAFPALPGGPRLQPLLPRSVVADLVGSGPLPACG